MVRFEKIVRDHKFSFEEDMVSEQVFFNVSVDIYFFKMIPDSNSWIIVGDVPPWISAIENKLSEIIDNELR